MRQPVTRALELTRAPKSATFDKVHEVSPGRGRWRAGDGHIPAGGKATDKPVDSGAHQARERLFLTRIELATQAIPHTRVGQREIMGGS